MRIFLPFLLILFCISTADLANAQIQRCNDQKEFVEASTDEILSIIKDKDLTEEKKEKRLVKSFEDLVDNKWMGKFVMGRNWRKLSEEQQKDYLKVYKNYLISTYIPRFREYNGQKLVVTNSTPLKKQDEHLVYANLKSEGEQDIEVAFRVRKNGVCYQIQDIIGEGVSLINTQRQDFGAVYKKKGYDGLIKTLNKKATQTKQASANQ